MRREQRLLRGLCVAWALVVGCGEPTGAGEDTVLEGKRGSLSQPDTAPPTVTCPEPVIAEATSAAGAVVQYPLAQAVDDVTASPTVDYSHPRGGTFPLGTTQVSVTAADEAGNTASCAFSVTVRDTTPPHLVCPANIIAQAVTAGSAHVEYPPATVSDAATPASSLAVFFSPLSGNRFFLGETPVTAFARDAAGNTATCSFTVTVVTRKLNVACQLPPATEATSPLGATVFLEPGIVVLTDGSFPYPREVTFSPASGSLFPKGATRVTATVRDSQGAMGNCTFNVQVRDTTPPVITCPSFLLVEATSSAGAVANIPEPTWTDAASTAVTFNYSPPPGFTFPLGAMPRSATATDEAGNVSHPCSTFVVVQDTTPPAVTCGGDLTVEATGPEGATVTYPAPVATDAVTASPALSATHASGSVFPRGTTRVTITARDAAGNAGTCAFNVHVLAPPPTITCPADVVAEATGPHGAAVTFSAATPQGGPLPADVGYSHAQGSVFPLGTTAVTATVSDAEGRTASCTFSVTVRDTTPPALSCPADVFAMSRHKRKGRAVSYPAPQARDAVSEPRVDVSAASGQEFPVGTTPVQVTATDAAGNSAACNFQVTVIPRKSLQGSF